MGEVGADSEAGKGNTKRVPPTYYYRTPDVIAAEREAALQEQNNKLRDKKPGVLRGVKVDEETAVLVGEKPRLVPAKPVPEGIDDLTKYRQSKTPSEKSA